MKIKCLKAASNLEYHKDTIEMYLVREIKQHGHGQEKY